MHAPIPLPHMVWFLGWALAASGICMPCMCMHAYACVCIHMHEYTCMSTSTYACMHAWHMHAGTCMLDTHAPHMHAWHACLYGDLIPCAPPPTSHMGRTLLRGGSDVHLHGQIHIPQGRKVDHHHGWSHGGASPEDTRGGWGTSGTPRHIIHIHIYMYIYGVYTL